MTALSRRRMLRPGSWSLVTKGAVGLGLGLVIGAVALAILVSQTIRDRELESRLSEFELLAKGETERRGSIVEDRFLLGDLALLARSEVLVERAQERNDTAEQGILPDSPGTDEQINRLIEIFLLNNKQFPLVIATDSDGVLLGSNVEVGRVDFGGEPWFDRSSRSVFLSDKRDTMALWGVPGVEVSLPLQNDLNQSVGMLYAVWDVASDPSMTSPPVPQVDRVWIINREGVVVTESIGEGTMVGQTVLGPQVLEEVFGSRRLGSVAADDEHGVEKIYGYSRLERGVAFELSQSVGDLDWTVVISRDSEVLFTEAQSLVHRLWVLIAVYTVVVIGGMVLLLRALTAPLGRLTNAARRIGAGQLDVVIPELGDDEVGRLADVLRGTVSQLTARVNQLRSAARVTSVARSVGDVSHFLDDVASVMHEEFGFRQVRIYLLDSIGEILSLEAVAGDIDVRLRDQKHRVVVDNSTIIGRSVGQGFHQVQRGDDMAAGRVSELAVPLRGSETWIGSMYVTSNRPDAFGPDELNVIELVADQVSASMQNARLFEQSTTNLRQIEALNRQLAKEGWTDFVGSTGQMRYVLSGSADDGQWPAEMDGVARNGKMVTMSQVEDEDGRALLAVPIVLGGEVVGTLGVRRPEGYMWSEDEIAIVQSVADRVGTIAEGIRRLDEANRAVNREQKVGAVSAKLQSASQVDSLLQMALDELGGALGSDSVALRIGAPPTSDESGPPTDDKADRNDAK